MYEDELEAFLIRVVPDLRNTWIGTPGDEIDRIENLTGHALPLFYRWFLSKMGKSMGSFAFSAREFSFDAVIKAYLSGQVVRDTRLMMIGYESNELMPQYIYYDLQHRVRDDARIVSCPVDDDAFRLEFETFRELLGWSAMLDFRIFPSAQYCEGTFDCDKNDVLVRLKDAMTRLGFVEPVRTGACCGLFDHPQAALAATIPPSGEAMPYMFFKLGASDEASLRRILGTIATETSLTIEIDEGEQISSE